MMNNKTNVKMTTPYPMIEPVVLPTKAELLAAIAEWSTREFTLPEIQQLLLKVRDFFYAKTTKTDDIVQIVNALFQNQNINDKSIHVILFAMSVSRRFAFTSMLAHLEAAFNPVHGFDRITNSFSIDEAGKLVIHRTLGEPITVDHERHYSEYMKYVSLEYLRWRLAYLTSFNDPADDHEITEIRRVLNSVAEAAAEASE